eukprot:4564582-Prymnesium_polylepis.2
MFIGDEGLGRSARALVAASRRKGVLRSRGAAASRRVERSTPPRGATHQGAGGRSARLGGAPIAHNCGPWGFLGGSLQTTIHVLGVHGMTDVG